MRVKVPKLLISLVLVSGLALACARTPPVDVAQAEKHYDLAADYLGKRMTAAALRETEEALKQNPAYPEAHWLLGAIKLGIAVQELEMTERSTCLSGPTAALGRRDAEAKLREAQGHFREALKHRADYPQAWDALASVALHFREFDAALEYEHKALQNPVFAENHIARSNLGWAYFGKGDSVRAEVELRGALVRQPEFCVGHYRLAEVLWKRGDVDGALDALGEIEKRRGVCRIQEAFHLLGRIASQRKQAERALAALDSCQQLAPRSCLASECKKLALTMPHVPPRDTKNDDNDRAVGPGEEG